MAIFLLVVEILLLVAVAILAILWIVSGGSTYEPWTLLIGLGIPVLEIIRRQLPSEGTQKLDEDTVSVLRRAAQREPLSRVLPRILSFSRRHGLDDLEYWTKMELYGWGKENGMRSEDRVPEYRMLSGQWYDQFMQPLMIKDPNLSFIHEYPMRSGVGDLEGFTERTDPLFLVDHDMIKTLNDALKVQVVQFSFTPLVTRSMLDRIRGRLLEQLDDVERDLKAKTDSD